MDTSNLAAMLARALTREPSKGAGRASVPVAWATTRGLARKENQDRILIARASNGLFVAILADGMGGMKEGGKAAVLAASAVGAQCVAAPDSSPEGVLREALLVANDEVFRALQGEGGAALVVVISVAGVAYVGHAGDARAYSLPSTGALVQLTVDDTVHAQMVHMGRAADPGSPSSHHLLQFVGLGRGFEPHITRVPTDARGLLLTSDGAHSLPLPVLEWIAAGADHLQMLADRVVTASEWHGGKDNATVLAVGLQNGHVAQPEIAAEFWLPNDHFVVISQPTRQAASLRPVSESIVTVASVKPAREQTERRTPKRQRGKKQTPESRKRSSRKQHDSRPTVATSDDRQLPMITFELDVEHPTKETVMSEDKVAPSDDRPGGRVADDNKS